MVASPKHCSTKILDQFELIAALHAIKCYFLNKMKSLLGKQVNPDLLSTRPLVFDQMTK